jgi:hypothetical protein
MDAKSTLFVEQKPSDKIFIFNSSKKLANVRVKETDNSSLFIESTSQIEKDDDLKETLDILSENYRPIVILLDKKVEFLENIDSLNLSKVSENQLSGEKRTLREFEIKWNEELKDNGRKFGFLKSSVTIMKEFDYTDEMEEANHYIELKTNEKYEIRKVEILDKEEFTLSESCYEHMIHDKRHMVFRFPYDKRPPFVKITWEIGIPKMVFDWTLLGIAIGILIPSVLLALSQTFVPNIPNILPILGAVIAILIGFRLLLFHDTDLMINWSRIYLGLISYSLLTSLLLIYVFLVNSHK